MSLLENASLIVTPNAYGEGKIYAVKPTDGSGDLTWSRASTKTRVNPSGLVAEVPYNLLQRSEEFDNAIWVKTNVTVSPNVIADPNGNLTADLLTPTSSDSYVRYLSFNGIAGTTYTLSFYARATVNRNIRIRQYNTTEANGTIEFITITNEWQRFSVTSVCGVNQQVQLWIGGGGTFVTGEDFYIWGAQLTQGTDLKPYFKTTDRLNVPSIDYTGGECPSILVEPQRTNLLTQSNFLLSDWIPLACTFSPNSIISPDGTMNGNSLVEDGTNQPHWVYQTKGTAATHTASVYAKKAGRDWLVLRTTTSVGVSYTYFNLNTGTIGTIGAGHTAKMTALTNGWYRCEVTSTLSGSVPYVIGAAISNNTLGYQGTNGLTAIYLWGAQLEAGSYATSYIPTTTAAVTRVADVVRKTGISSLIGQAAGAFIVNAKLTYGTVTNTTFFSISDGTNNNQLRIIRGSSNNSIRVIFQLNGGVLQYDVNNLIINFSTVHKIGVVYSSGFIKVSIDGATVASSSNALTLSAPLSVIGICNPTGTFDHSEPLNYKEISIIPNSITEVELNRYTTL